MNSLEDRLRDSLNARAADVEPTPQLWDRVAEETSRRTRRGWLYAGLGAAAAVAVAMVVIPAILDQADAPQPPIVEQPPSIEPTEDPALGAPSLVGALTTDGNRIVLHGTEPGADGLVLVDLDPASCECRIFALDVTAGPAGAVGSDRFDVVYTVRAEGMWEHRWIRAERDGIGSWEVSDSGTFPVDLSVSSASAPGSTPYAIFSPDGDAVAWIEQPVDEQAAGPVLRTISLGDEGVSGPEFGRTADVLTDLPLRPYQLRSWTWNFVDAPIAVGEMVLTAAVEGIEGYRLPVSRNEQGETHPDGSPGLMDLVVGYDHDGAGGAYLLLADGVDNGEVVLSLNHVSGDGAPSTPIDLPDAARRTTDTTTNWLAADGTRVLIGAAGGAWLIDTATGLTVEVPGTVTAAAWFGPVAASPDGAPPPVDPPVAVGEATVAVSGLGDVDLIGPDGEVITRLIASECTNAEDCEFRPTRVIVRPGSTVDDLTALVLWLGDGAELGMVTYVDGEVGPYAPFFDTGRIDPAVVGSGSLPVPVWSPDGNHVAWIEEHFETGEFTLRTMGWADGPGTGAAATDNASWTIDPSSAGTGDVDLELARWQPWVEEPGGTEVSAFTLRTRSANGVFLADGLAIERQSDGALALREDGFGYDHIVEPHAVDAAYAPSGTAWLLQVGYDGEPVATEPSLFRAPGSGEVGAVFPAPADVVAFADDGWHLWIEAGEDVAYVPNGRGGTYRVDRDGTFTPMTGWTHAVAVG